MVVYINGENNMWFCGVWMKNGFYEDGFSSVYDVVDVILLCVFELIVVVE